MPNMKEIFLKLDGFQYATSLDLIMGCYNTRVSNNTSNLCTIILPKVKYCHKQLLMGIENSPVIYQQAMNDLFHGFGFICAHID